MIDYKKSNQVRKDFRGGAARDPARLAISLLAGAARDPLGAPGNANTRMSKLRMIHGGTMYGTRRRARVAPRARIRRSAEPRRQPRGLGRGRAEWTRPVESGKTGFPQERQI